ncbi:MAG: CpsD/CapB family tyrosine-protein kinase [Caldiserica bacterium]|nr:CpsD/CapB family tyrosine-protein kinase [Caldisericota bacterium]
MKKRAKRKSKDGYYYGYGEGAVEEAFRTLRTNFFSAIKTPEGSLNTFLVTSPAPGDGKTSILLLLGKYCGEVGKKVLLIDTDLRKPALHRYLNMSPERGVVKFLRGEMSVEEVIHSTPMPNVSAIPCEEATSNPGTLLTTPRFKELLSYAQKHYDFVFLDSPPVLLVSDPGILAQEVGSVILIVSQGQTSRRAGMQVKNHLERLNAKIIGVILNRAERSEGGYYYYRYYSSKKEE